MSPPRRFTRDFRRNEDAIIAAIDQHYANPSLPIEVTTTAPYRWKLSDCAIIHIVTAAWRHYFPNAKSNRQ